MSGTPTEAEIQTQWKNAVAVLESVRGYADGTVVPGGGILDTLIQSLEGDYTPSGLVAFAAQVRSGLSAMITPSTATDVYTTILYEYARILQNDASVGFGSSYRQPAELQRALYEWFVAKGTTVKTRGITFSTSPTLGGTNVGNGAMDRLTVDENNFPLEACHVEKKAFRCRSDQNSGVDKWAEVFEFTGTVSAPDSLLRGNFGSGESARTTITSAHAGSSSGGSLLTNSSFSEYSGTATPKFTAWTEFAGGTLVSQDTTNFYRSHPGAQTDASLKITASGSTTVTLKQSIANMRSRRMDPNAPYYLRIMVNKTIGTAVGGTVTIRLGSKSASIAIGSLGAGWQELKIALGTSNWFRKFDEDNLDVEIEWAQSTSTGFLLIDDVLFAPFTLIDGTYWFLRQNAATPTAWMVDDTLTFTDTGGAPGSGKLNYWMWVAGLGYLPSSGTPTIADP